MKVFRELELEGQTAVLIKAIENIEAKLDNEWARDRDREKGIWSAASKPMYCFSCVGSSTREASEVWLAYKGDTTLYLANVVPKKVGQLTFDQYNAIVEEFSNRFVEPVAKALGIKHSLGSTEKDIDAWLSEAAAHKLRVFSHQANKSTGSGHPSDQQRWFEFLLVVHGEHAKLRSDMLERWLIESEGWPEETANRLASEYEFGLELLDFYDNHFDEYQ